MINESDRKQVNAILETVHADAWRSVGQAFDPRPILGWLIRTIFPGYAPTPPTDGI